MKRKSQLSVVRYFSVNSIHTYWGQALWVLQLACLQRWFVSPNIHKSLGLMVLHIHFPLTNSQNSYFSFKWFGLWQSEGWVLCYQHVLCVQKQLYIQFSMRNSVMTIYLTSAHVGMLMRGMLMETATLLWPGGSQADSCWGIQTLQCSRERGIHVQPLQLWKCSMFTCFKSGDASLWSSPFLSLEIVASQWKTQFSSLQLPQVLCKVKEDLERNSKNPSGAGRNSLCLVWHYFCFLHNKWICFSV